MCVVCGSAGVGEGEEGGERMGKKGGREWGSNLRSIVMAKTGLETHWYVYT